MSKPARFFGPLITFTLVFLLFAKSFPAEGECAMGLFAIVPVLFVFALLFGVGVLLLSKKYFIRGLTAITLLATAFLLFFYPVSCEDSPFSTIGKMRRILSNKSSIQYGDLLQYLDKERHVAALKKIRKELSPEKVYEVTLREDVYGYTTLLNTLIYFKQNKVHCIDPTLFDQINDSTLKATSHRYNLELFFKGDYVDTEKMHIDSGEFVNAPKHENYSRRIQGALQLTITYNDGEFEDAYAHQRFWAYKLFY